MSELTDPGKMFDPIEPFDLFNPSLPSTLNLTTKVTIVPETDKSKKNFLISWQAQAAAVRYNIHVSASPVTKQKFAEAPKTQTSVLLEIPIIVPSDMTFFVWVSFINQFGKEIFIQEEPVHTLIDGAFETNPLPDIVERDIITNQDMKYYPEEIRRRSLATLHMNGEPFSLHIRRRSGQPCVCLTEQAGEKGRVAPHATDSYIKLGTFFDSKEVSRFEQEEARDPEYQAITKCKDCFGTGIAGGYFPKIAITIRYGEAPQRILKKMEQGMEMRHDFNSWTTWHPKLKIGDFLIRIRNNDRFSVKDPSQSEWRGITARQMFTAVHLPNTDPTYSVTDEKIREGLISQSSFNIGKWTWAVFV